MTERIITVKKTDDKIIYTGSTERTTAEHNGIRHLTVIAAPVITDGKHKGKLLVHNRRDKQLAKGIACPEYSYNLFGGHCNPPKEDSHLIGKPVSEDLLLKNIARELNEEMYFPSESAESVSLENITDSLTISAKPFMLNKDDLIPLGYTEYSSKHDKEYSYVYVLPLSSETAESIIAVDDYQKLNGTNSNLSLPTALMTLDELHSLYQSSKPNVEICNAISRLWDKRNETVYQKLITIINDTADM